MDPDDYRRCRFAVMFCVLAIFLMATFSAATARKNAADSREQGGNAYEQDDVFHIFACFVVSSEDSS
jgi:hypothetical protein